VKLENTTEHLLILSQHASDLRLEFFDATGTLRWELNNFGSVDWARLEESAILKLESQDSVILAVKPIAEMDAISAGEYSVHLVYSLNKHTRREIERFLPSSEVKFVWAGDEITTKKMQVIIND
jgi:hypothetical protein